VNIADLLTTRAAATGDAPALVDESSGARRILSFRELERAVARVAYHLHTLGLRPGDPVLVLQPLSVELCLLLVAILRAGLVAVFVDPSAGMAHLDACCRLTAPRAFIGSGKAHLLRLVSPGLRRIPIKARTGSLIRKSRAFTPTDRECSPAVDLPPSAPALVRFTSGSTGGPKAAVRTHGYLLAQLRALESNLHLAAGQIDLVTMPMFMLPNLAAGVTTILPTADVRAPGRVEPAPLIDQIRSNQVSRLTASPALLQRLADHCARRHVTLDSLQRLDTGGAPVFPGLLDSLRVMAPQARIVAVYGSTEAEPIALLDHSDMSESDRQAIVSGHGLLAGHPVPDIRIHLIREDTAPPRRQLTETEFQDLLAPDGAPGEIVVSGPHVHPGQSSDPAAEPTKLFAGAVIWHRTGDTGRLGPDGRLWLLGRSSARIQDARGTLHPFQIEAAVLTDPGIRRAALASAHGRRLLVLELADRSQQPRLPPWVQAQIDEVRIVRHIPLDRRHNAKVDYPKLLKQLSSWNAKYPHFRFQQSKNQPSSGRAKSRTSNSRP
jgi:acyl-CoA synthetase (AMP-forming)/AMP-acid ligase II